MSTQVVSDCIRLGPEAASESRRIQRRRFPGSEIYRLHRPVPADSTALAADGVPETPGPAGTPPPPPGNPAFEEAYDGPAPARALSHVPMPMITVESTSTDAARDQV